VSSAHAGGAASSVYVHVPFCDRQCGYCDFAIWVGRNPDATGWLESISAEWQSKASNPKQPLAEQLDTLYIGGGTPSTLGARVMADLRDVFGTTLLSNPNIEWTAEANPESLDRDVLAAWEQAGVTRVSLGVQSFHEPTLRWMGRLHGPEGGRAALDQILDCGFRSATVDLIFGVPQALGRSWTSDLDAVVASRVPHISLYGLTVEEGTPLFNAVAAERTTPVNEAQYEAEYLQAADRLTSEGYEHYEVSSFALPGHRSAHNQQYWTGAPYVGLGNGAHSFFPPVRSWNVRGWPEYRDRIAAEASPIEDEEVVDGESRRLERLWLGLRRAEGVPLGWIRPSTVETWCKAGYATLRRDRVRLTPRGWLLLDQLTVAASTEMHPSSSTDLPKSGVLA